MGKSSKLELKIIKRYSEELKRKVVLEVESGRMSVSGVVESFDISSPSVVHNWLRKYGKLQPKIKLIRIDMDENVKKLRELEKALSEEKVRNMLYKYELEYMHEHFPDSELKKKLNTKQLKDLENIQERRFKLQ